MTASRGIGKGNNSGGKNPGAGRPPGSRNRRSAALIAEAEREGLLMPVDYLLSIMRDPTAELRDRAYAATAAAPYCHSKLVPMPVFADLNNMDDASLTIAIARLEQRIAEQPPAERAETAASHLETLLEELPLLPGEHQKTLLARLKEAVDAGLERLNDPARPGAVPPRGSTRAVAVAAVPVQRYTPPASHDATTSRPARRLRYNPATGELEPVA